MSHSLLDRPAPSARHGESALVQRYRDVRDQTVALTASLEPEDCTISSMPDVSPTKWHLAHTTWFFETFVLGPHAVRYVPLQPRYAYLFNSYYVQAGERHCRAQRGLVSRPTLREVFAYRSYVDTAMERLCGQIETGRLPETLRALVELGLQHEQQHQELILSDIKHVFWMNPLRPAYSHAGAPPADGPAPPLRWAAFEEGIRTIGLEEATTFGFDNERPPHRVIVPAFQLASRCVTNGEYAAFIADGGYDRATLWLSDGWAAARAGGWRAPLYWEWTDGGWTEFTLGGTRALDPAVPVMHLSFFEADAFARWAGVRLPTEHEWEVAAAEQPVTGTFLEAARWHADVARGEDPLQQLYGDVWQFTTSPYLGYPGFRPAAGAIGEYNGKFMCDQWVLRGASFATPQSHARRTYRNFYPAPARWQFGGIRLARSA